MHHFEKIETYRTQKAQRMMNHSMEDRCFDISNTPTTRFQGSKRKILPWIWDHLKDRGFDSVLDVFGGTGSVSYLFKTMGKRVTYNDVLRWNYLVGRALIENDNVKLTPSEIGFLTQPPTNSDSDFVSRTFKGIYFKNQENLWIDALASRIKKIKSKEGNKGYRNALAYYGVFQTCLIKRPFNLFHRANLYIRTRDVARSFGNKTTWEKPFRRHLRFFLEEANTFIINGKQPCRAINCDAAEIPADKYDLVYLDPPYIKKNSDNETADYLWCYHFLEGLARYQEWPDLIDYTHKILPIAPPALCEWTDVKKNTAAFENLFEKFSKSILVISYKKYGSPSVDTLVRMLKRHRKTVNVYTKHYKYALNQQNGSAELNRECLIIGE